MLFHMISIRLKKLKRSLDLLVYFEVYCVLSYPSLRDNQI